MLKIKAINLLGGSLASAAAALGVSYQAVNKWPDVLPDRIADRVLGACVRCGIHVPGEYTNAKLPPLSDVAAASAAAPLTADPALQAELAKAEQAGLVLLPKQAPVWDGVERRTGHVRRAEDRERLGLNVGAAGQGV